MLSCIFTAFVAVSPPAFQLACSYPRLLIRRRKRTRSSLIPAINLHDIRRIIVAWEGCPFIGRERVRDTKVLEYLHDFLNRFGGMGVGDTVYARWWHQLVVCLDHSTSRFLCSGKRNCPRRLGFLTSLSFGVMGNMPRSERTRNTYRKGTSEVNRTHSLSWQLLRFAAETTKRTHLYWFERITRCSRFRIPSHCTSGCSRSCW